MVSIKKHQKNNAKPQFNFNSKKVLTPLTLDPSSLFIGSAKAIEAAPVENISTKNLPNHFKNELLQLKAKLIKLQKLL